MNDDELRTRVRRADPAGALPPLGHGARTAVLEAAAAAPLRDRPDRPGRRARAPIVVGTGLALAAAVTGAIVLAPRPRVPSAPDGPSVVLRLPGTEAATASCARLADFAAEALAGSDLAFRGRVTSTAPGTVDVVPDHVYRGPATRLVRLRTDVGGGPALDGADLRRGEQVLVAASDGQVDACGLSAADSPALRRYYEQAFD